MPVRGRIAVDDQGRLVMIDPAADEDNITSSDIQPLSVDELDASNVETAHTWLTEQSGPPTDSDIGSGNVALYAKTDDKLYRRPHGGSESSLVIRTRQANIPLTEIADGNTAVGLQAQVPSGKTLKIFEVGVTDDSESAPSGLTVEVRDLTNAVNIVSQNTLHNDGTPIASKAGQIDVQFRVNNGTGGTVNASGYALYTME